MNNPVRINLHGELEKIVGKKSWEVHVNSAAEGIHAINCQTEDSIRKYFLREDKRHARYKVLIDNKEIPFNGNLKDNELNIERQEMQTMDIVPVLEGSGFFDSAWGGIILGVIGLGFASNQFAIMASLSLITQGIANMLSKPPPMPEARQMTNPSSDPAALANSYLFNGPVNVINEGGPVPLGYGRLTIGSQVIMSSYDIKTILIRDAGRL